MNDEFDPIREAAKGVVQGLVAFGLLVVFVWLVFLWFATASFGQEFHRSPSRQVTTCADNPTTPAAISLGHKLFFDTRFSVNGTVACATCHDPRRAFTDGRPRAIGVSLQPGHRNSPTILNAAYQRRLMWDGRFEMLEGQAEFPVLDAGEMGMNRQLLVARLNAVPGYVREFNAVYGRNPTETDFCRAIASFERTLVAKDDPFSSYLAGDLDQLSDSGVRGALLFVGLVGQDKQAAVMGHGKDYSQQFIAHYFRQGTTGCAACHNGPDYRDGLFHRTGVAFQRTDDGLQVISNNDADLKKFKTPTLLNVVETAPYFHDGSRATLGDVVRYYNQGGVNDPRRDPRIRPLGMTLEEEQLLVGFVAEGLRGEYPQVEQPVLP